GQSAGCPTPALGRMAQAPAGQSSSRSERAERQDRRALGEGGKTLMKFQITGQGWPIGQHLIPSGTLIDFSEPNIWTALATEIVIPINATPLDEEAWEAQLRAYPEHRHLLGGGWG